MLPLKNMPIPHTVFGLLAPVPAAMFQNRDEPLHPVVLHSCLIGTPQSAFVYGYDDAGLVTTFKSVGRSVPPDLYVPLPPGVATADVGQPFQLGLTLTAADGTPHTVVADWIDIALELCAPSTYLAALQSIPLTGPRGFEVARFLGVTAPMLADASPRRPAFSRHTHGAEIDQMAAIAVALQQKHPEWLPGHNKLPKSLGIGSLGLN